MIDSVVKLLKKYKKLIMYMLVGAFTTIVNIGSFWIFYNLIELGTVTSNIIAWVFGVIFGYFANKLFVFESKSFRAIVFLSEFVSFVLARLSTGIIDTVIMYIFVDVLLFDDLLVKIVSNVIVIILNYILSEFIVFSKKKANSLVKLLADEAIEFVACVPLKKCKVVKNYLLEKNGLGPESNVVMMLLPYRSKNQPKNITVYASVKDYHLYVEALSKRLEGFIKKKHPHANFKVFADHSPIDEVHAACISGLGFIGDNGLLINEKYSSFVFLCECITDLSAKELGLKYSQTDEVKKCLHCGKCKNACPCGCIGTSSQKKVSCLSAITQKKGDFNDEEKELILANGSIWGCDACQNACPYTKNASFTPIGFFNEDIITTLDRATLSSLSDEELKARPFSWRGYEVISRNVELYENHREKK